MKKIYDFKARQLGQGMTEYIIIVALIAVAAIGTYGFFGQSIRNQVAGLTSEISGQNSSKQIEAAQKSAEEGTKIAKEEYNLSNYNEGADQKGAN
jgi:Flp pilus assembly pilin Flp